MKKLIYISGIVSVNLMLFGSLLKVLHIDGAGLLLLVSIALFCFGFLPLALISSYKSQAERNYKWLYIVTFLVFSIGLTGALFKIMHWPYAGVVMLIGVPLPFVLFLPVYLYQTRKNKEKSTLNNLGIMFGLTFLAIFSVFLTLNISSNVLDSFVVNAFNNENSARFTQSIAKNYGDKDIIKQKSEELCAFIDDLKCEVLTAANNNLCVNGKPKSDGDEAYIANVENRSAQVSIIFDGGGRSKIEILKGMTTQYSALVNNQERASKELKELSNTLFDINKEEFPSNQLAIVLDILSRIQSNVRFIEAEYLSAL